MTVYMVYHHSNRWRRDINEIVYINMYTTKAAAEQCLKKMSKLWSTYDFRIHEKEISNEYISADGMDIISK